MAAEPQLDGSLEWEGVNKLVEDSDINKGQSPEAINCFYFNGKKGLLGPRKGVTAVNSKAFPSNVAGIIPFNNIRLIATSDGEIITDESVDQVMAIGMSTIEDGSVGGSGSNQITINYPNLTGEATYTIGTPIALSGSYMMKFHPGFFEFQILSPSDYDTAVTITQKMWAIINGRDVLLGEFVYSAPYNNAGDTFGVLPFGGPSGNDHVVMVHSATGTLTGAKISLEISAWPAGATTGDSANNAGGSGLGGGAYL